VWNPQLGIGQHAQIVEVELQREYEGKGAYPNYAMAGVINGFPEMDPRIGLASVVTAEQLKGLWTWSRGGGWWGPYIHGEEQWVDLHVMVLLRWWRARGAMSEAAAFAEATARLLPGCGKSQECLASFRNFSLSAADVVLHGQWGVTNQCFTWMRDDRIGGLDEVSGPECLGANGASEANWLASLDERLSALATAKRNLALYSSSIDPHVTDRSLAEAVETSAEYAVHLYEVVGAGWPLLQHAYRLAHGPPSTMNASALAAGIQKYDAAIGAYRAFGLANVRAASLYHPYYLCLGTTCSGAFDPPPCDMGPSQSGKNRFGLAHTVDSLRAVAAASSRTTV
jgi:hypothetical protein